MAAVSAEELGCRVAMAALNEVGVSAWVDDGSIWIETEITENVPPETIHRAIQLGRRAAGLPAEVYAEWAARMGEDGLGDMANYAKWLKQTT